MSMRTDLLGPVRDTWPPRGSVGEVVDTFEQHRVELGSLIEGGAGEREVHAFLEAHPLLILHASLDGFFPVASSRSLLFSHVRLAGEYEVDFLYGSMNSMGLFWTFIELESPSAKMFTRRGDPSAALSHALRQVLDWRSWLQDNPAYAERTLRELAQPTLDDYAWSGCLRRPPQSLIIMGRRSDLTERTNRLRAQICTANPLLEILTYDRLFDHYHVDKSGEPDAGQDEVRSIRPINRA